MGIEFLEFLHAYTLMDQIAAIAAIIGTIWAVVYRVRVNRKEGLLKEQILSELDDLIRAPPEVDLPKPDREAIENARTLIPKLMNIYPAHYHVSATERRGIQIEAPMKTGAAVGIECAPDDTVYCFVVIGNQSRRAKYYQMDSLPDEFMDKALRDLAGHSDPKTSSTESEANCKNKRWSNKKKLERLSNLS